MERATINFKTKKIGGFTSKTVKYKQDNKYTKILINISKVSKKRK